MTAEPTAKELPLTAVLTRVAALPLAEKLWIVGQVATQVAEIHASHRIHRCITAASVHVAPSCRVSLAAVEPMILLGGSDEDGDLIPPDLRNLDRRNLPADVPSIRQLLQDSGIDFDPRRIDLFQLAALLCQVVAHVRLTDYLRSPRSKGQIPAPVQRIIESAVGFESSWRYVQASEFVRDLSVLSAPLSSPAPETMQSALRLVSDWPTEDDVQHVDADTDTPIAQADTPVANPVSAADPGLPREATDARLPFTQLGHYKIESRIGCGGMGDVYKGFDQSLQRVVAIKVLPSELARNAELVKRFYAEASAIAKLVHTNILQIYFIGADAGHHFFAMQFVDGETLGDLLQRKHRLSVDETLAICEQCLHGLAAAHAQGLVHRDIKPGNILLDRKHRRALLADFGLAKALDAGNQMTATGVIMGTLDYISPEQGRGLPVDGRSDLYSFGVLMYQALSGRVPFDADTATAMLFKHAYDVPPPLSEIAPDVPPVLASIVERLLAKSPDERYPDATTLLQDLQAFHSGQPLGRYTSPGVERGFGQGPRQTIMFRHAALPEPPIVPADLLTPAEKPRWWAGFRKRGQSLLRRHAPEFLKQLQNTQQQVDGAVLDYERRVSQLESDVQQAESLLQELSLQLAECERTETESTSTSDLRRTTADQADQLGLMKVQLAQARATLLNLRSQRDLLNARLKAVQAEFKLGGRTTSRRFVALAVTRGIAYVALAAGLVVAVMFIRNPKAFEQLFAVGAGKSPTFEEHLALTTPNPKLTAPVSSVTVKDSPTCLAIAPTIANRMKTFAIGYADGNVEFFRTAGSDSDTGQSLTQQFKSINAGVGPVSGVVYSHDGTKLAIVGRQQHQAAIWDLIRSEVFRRIDTNSGSLETVEFSTDDSQIMTGGTDGAHIWELKSGRQMRTVEVPIERRWIQSLDWSRDGSSLLIGSRLTGMQSLALSSMNRKSELLEFDTHQAPASAARLSPDETQVFGLAPGVQKSNILEVHVWKVGQTAAVRKFGENVKVVDFSNDGKRAITDGPKHEIVLWDMETGQPIQKFQGHADEVRGVAISDTFRLAISVGKDHKARVWELPLPSDVESIEQDFMAPVVSVAFTAQGETFLAATRDGTVQEYDFVRPGNAVGRGPELSTVAVSANGKRWLTATGQSNSAENVVTVREGRAWSRTLRGHQDRINSAAFSRDGNQVVSGSKDGTIRVWDIQTEQEIGQLKAEVSVNSVAFAPTGPRRCLSGGDENVARLWDLETNKEIRQFVGHEFLVLSVAFSPDGKQAITGSADHTVRIWDVDTGNLMQTLKGHTGPVTSVAVSSRRSEFILSGSEDATMRRWDLKSGKLLQVLAGHAKPIRTVAIAPNGTRGISGSDDQTVRVWKFTTPTGTPLSPLDPVDLLPQLDLARESDKGAWKRDGAGLLTAPTDDAQLTLSNEISSEYQLKMVAERIAGDGPLVLNLVNGGNEYKVAFDAPAETGPVTTLNLVRKDAPPGNDVIWNGVELPAGHPHSILCNVRNGGIDVQVDQRTVLNWPHPPTAFKEQHALTLGGSSAGQFRITELSLVVIPRESDYLRIQRRSPEQRTLSTAWDRISTEFPSFPQDEVAAQLLRAGTLVPRLRTFQKPEEIEWHQVKLNTEGTKVSAVRFRSPLDIPADLRWLYTVSDDIRDWQIVSSKKDLHQFQQFRVEHNLQFPGVSLPSRNSVVFQDLLGGQIVPGEDYYIWFRFWHDRPLDLKCALQLTPVSTEPPASDAQAIAKHMGLPVPLRHVHQSDRELGRAGGSQRPVSWCEASPDGKYVLVADYQMVGAHKQHSARLLECQTQSIIWELPEGSEPVSSVEFSPNGQTLLMQHASRRCNVVDVRTGHERLQLTDVDGYYSWNITADGTKAIGVAGSFGIWDLATGKRLLQAKTAVTDRITKTALVPGTQELIAGSEEGELRVLNADTGDELRRLPSSGLTTGLCVSPDGRYAAVTTEASQNIMIWDIKSGELAREIRGHNSPLQAVAFSPDGSRLLSSAGFRYPTEYMVRGLRRLEVIEAPDHSIRLWDFATGREMLRIDDHPFFINYVHFSADGQQALSSSGDGTMRVWSLSLPPQSDKVASTQPEHIFKGHRQPVWSVAFTPDGRQALSGGGTNGDADDSGVRVWDLAQKQELRQFTEHADRITSISPEPHGKRVLTASHDGQVRLWNLETLEQTTGLPKRPGQVVKFAANGTNYLSGGQDILERRGLDRDDASWSLNYEKPPMNEKGTITGLGIDARGERAITCSEGENSVTVWNVTTGRVTEVLAGHSAPVESVAIADYGGLALSAGRDGTLRLWDISRGVQQKYFTGHTGPVLCAVLSADSRHAISGGQDGTVRLWDLDKGVQIWQGDGHTGGVRSVAFSPDGTRALSGGEDHAVCLWRLPDLALPGGQPDPNRTVAEWVLGQGGKIDVEIDGLTYGFTGKGTTLPTQRFMVTGVNLQKTATWADSDLEQLATLEKLRAVNLAETRVTDAGLAHLGKISTLESLNLSGAAIGNDGIGHLAALPRLQSLDLSGKPTQDSVPAAVGKLQRLSSLKVSKSALSDTGLTPIKSLPRLQRLEVNDAAPLPSDMVKRLHVALPFCRLN